MTGEEMRRRARVLIAAEQRLQEAGQDDLDRWEAEVIDHTQDYGGAM